MSDESMAVGLDPSRADLVGFTPDYWVSTDKLRDWLVDWDTWEDDKPAWFTMKELDFQNWVMTHAPPEALPRTPLLKILAKAKDSDQGNSVRPAPEADTDTSAIVMQSNDGVQFASATRAELVAMVKKQRAGLAFARFKQICIWSAALTFSYVDLVSTVSVAFQYLALGEKGRDAAYVTFGMLAGSIGLQAFTTYSTGPPRYRNF
jgi:hypothetical protein